MKIPFKNIRFLSVQCTVFVHLTSCTLWYGRILVLVNDFMAEEHQLSLHDNRTLKYLKPSALNFDLIFYSQGCSFYYRASLKFDELAVNIINLFFIISVTDNRVDGLITIYVVFLYSI